MDAGAIIARVACEIETADYAQTTPPLTAALVALYEAHIAFESAEDEYSDAQQGYDTKRLHETEAAREAALDAMLVALVAVTAIVEGSEAP
jgi:hypothetical protein